MDLNNISISIMNLQDLETIKDILENEFDDFWNYNIFKSELENLKSIYFVAKIDNEIIGFAGILIVIDEADITNIVVKKNCRGMRYFKYTYELFD
jgi:ribosomal-protein-alanine N-acetyltransferase